MEEDTLYNNGGLVQSLTQPPPVPLRRQKLKANLTKNHRCISIMYTTYSVWDTDSMTVLINCVLCKGHELFGESKIDHFLNVRHSGLSAGASVSLSPPPPPPRFPLPLSSTHTHSLPPPHLLLPPPASPPPLHFLFSPMPLPCSVSFNLLTPTRTPVFFFFISPLHRGMQGWRERREVKKTTTSSLWSHIILCTGKNKVQNIKQEGHFTILSWNISSYFLVLATDVSDKLYCFCSSQCISTISITPCVNTKTFGERSFSYAGPSVWNNLPQTLHHSDSTSSFKASLKMHLFNNYF